MYRKCKSIHVNNHYNDPVKINPSFVIDGHERYLKKANELYMRYRDEIERIMHFYGCKHECELFVGICLGDICKNEENKGNLSQISAIELKSLWQFYRNHFYKEINDNLKSNETLESKASKQASAWYVACYSSELNLTRTKIISFPWIIENVFHHINNVTRFDQFSKSVVKNYLYQREKYNGIATFIEKVEYMKK